MTGRTSTCNCWETDRIGPAGLSLGTHKIVFTNTTASGYDATNGPAGGLDIQQWKVDTGGAALHDVTYVNANDPLLGYSNVTFTADSKALSGSLAKVPKGGTVTMYANNAASLKIAVVDNGAAFTVTENGKLLPQVTLPNTGAYGQYHFIEWGLQPTVQKLVITVTSAPNGPLSLDKLSFSQYPDLGFPALTTAAIYLQPPVLTAYGDSVALGRKALGPDADSDGYTERLAAKNDQRLVNLAVSDTTGTCYGVNNLAGVTSSHPDRVLVDFGANDLAGASACPTTLPQFTSAMDQIVTGLQSSLPGVPIYLGSILSVPAPNDVNRAAWNAAIQGVADNHGLLYVDPSSTAGYDPATDLVDTYHPNNGGAQKMADAWAAAIPWNSADLSLSVSLPPNAATIGQPFTYTYTVTNQSASIAEGITLTAPVPSGTTLSSMTQSFGNCSGTTTVVCKLVALPNAAATKDTVTVTVIPGGAGPFSSTATVAGWNADPSRANNQATVSFGTGSGVDTTATTTTLSSDVNPSVAGQSVNFTATVTPASGSILPTGTVTFADGVTTLGTEPLDSAGQAVFATTSLTVGAHTVTAAYGGDTSFTASTSPAVTQTVNSSTDSVVYRVNAGGAAFSDASGNWTADTAASPSLYTNASATGDTVFKTTHSINTTQVPGLPASLFKTQRYAAAGGTDMQWEFPVASGWYTVRLYFAETYSPMNAAGKRVFNVDLETSPMLTNFDVFAAAGGQYKGIVRSAVVQVTDGSLSLDFAHVVDNPEVQAIEVLTAAPPAP